MDTLTDRLERLAELQKKNLEPLQGMGETAFAAFERVARKNYELMGDMVDYAVMQSRGSLEQRTPQALYAHQIAAAKAFAERMGARAAEYAVLAEEMRAGLGPHGEPGGVDASASSPVARDDEPRSPAPSAPAPSSTAKAVPAGTAAAKKSAKKRTSAASTAKRSASARSAAKGGTARKTAVAKAGAKKTAAKKTAAKKTAAKKTGAKKAGAKKRAARSRSSD